MDTKDDAKYGSRELAQLVRRRMLQRDHGDKSKYTRKKKHKNKNYNFSQKEIIKFMTIHLKDNTKLKTRQVLGIIKFSGSQHPEKRSKVG